MEEVVKILQYQRLFFFSGTYKRLSIKHQITLSLGKFGLAARQLAKASTQASSLKEKQVQDLQTKRESMFVPRRATKAHGHKEDVV